VSRILVASGNAHKLEEYADLFPGVPVVGLGEYPDAPDPVEDAPDFIGNAIIKAKSARAHSGLMSLADDSGIAVDALDGAPGIYSARYAPGTDADRMFALLEAMEAHTDRGAQFVCAIAIAGVPEGTELPEGLSWREGCVVTQGIVRGTLTRAPRGSNGFGYDPIFELPSGRTTAELSADAKHAISHRGVAARTVIPLLNELFS
jgi:XTP/dITP diphosphohydrolase